MFVPLVLHHVRRTPFAPLKFRNKLVTLPLRTMTSESEKTATHIRRADYFGNFKDLFKKYGYVFVGTYMGLYVSTLASVYLALEMDVFNASTFGYDAQTLIKKVK